METNQTNYQSTNLEAPTLKKTNSEIRLPNGHITTDHLQINEAFRDLYTKLYTSESHVDCGDICNILNGRNIPSLSPDLRKRLEEPISLAEIALAISSMQSGKCLGPDGFLAELLKKFSLMLPPLLHKVLSESCRQGSLPPSCTEACIMLTAKKATDPMECASYRSISLLNTDPKILAKILAHRLENALPTIIPKDQTGFVKGGSPTST